MKSDADAAGILYSDYWIVFREAFPMQIGEHLAAIKFPAVSIELDMRSKNHPWIIARTKGLLSLHKMYSVNVNAFARKDEAVAETRKLLRAEQDSYLVQAAKVDDKLKALKRWAHVRGPDDCCEFEDRSFSGGCLTCGDPCL